MKTKTALFIFTIISIAISCTNEPISTSVGVRTSKEANDPNSQNVGPNDPTQIPVNPNDPGLVPVNPSTNPNPGTNPVVTPNPNPNPTTAPAVDPLPYASKYTNADGSITINEPRFVFQGVQERLIENTYTPALGTTAKGICTLFGLKKMNYKVLAAGKATNGVKLQSTGTYAGSVDTYPYAYITQVTCALDVPVGTPLPAANVFANTDGSKTIVQPRFMFNNKLERLVENTYSTTLGTTADGICKYFGMKTVAQGGKVLSADPIGPGVELHKTGEFKTFNPSTYPFKFIQSVTCLP